MTPQAESFRLRRHLLQFHAPDSAHLFAGFILPRALLPRSVLCFFLFPGSQHPDACQNSKDAQSCGQNCARSALLPLGRITRRIGAICLRSVGFSSRRVRRCLCGFGGSRIGRLLSLFLFQVDLLLRNLRLAGSLRLVQVAGSADLTGTWQP